MSKPCSPRCGRRSEPRPPKPRPRGARSRAQPHQRRRLRGPQRARRGDGDRALPARRAARPLRDVLERALPGLRRRARRKCHAEIGRPRRVQLRALRRRLRADPRRDGRGHLHGEPAGAQDCGPRSEHAVDAGVYAPDLLGLRRRPAGQLRRDHRGDHARSGRASARRKGPPFAAAPGGLRDLCSIP